MSKIEIFGDIHGDFRLFTTLVNMLNVDAIVQVGDFKYWPNDPFYEKQVGFLNNLNKPVYFIDGNHEHHLKLQEFCNNTDENIIEIMKNVYYIRRGSLVNICDYNIFCMGGAFSIDRGSGAENVDWFKEETISYKDMIHLPDPNSKIDLMISHTCPNEFVGNIAEYISAVRGYDIYIDNDPSREALSQILNTYNIKQWYFGHWHTYLKNKYKHINWTCLSSFQSKEKCHEPFEFQ